MPPIESSTPDVIDQPIAMSHQYTFDNLDFLWDIFMWIGWLIPLVLFVFYAYCQYLLSKKLNVENSWMAFIPLLNIYNLFQIAQVSLWWIVWLFIPLVNIVVGIVLAIKINHGISTRTGHGVGWTIWLIFLNFIMFPITAFTYNPPVTDTTPVNPVV